MAKLIVVAKSRKSPGTCNKCGTVIEAGQPYRHWTHWRGRKNCRCMACPAPRASELADSDKIGRVYAAAEAIEDAIAGWDRDSLDDIKTPVEDAMEQVREVAGEYEESASNMEDAFQGGSPQIDALQEKSQHLEGVADDIDGVISDFEEFDAENVDDIDDISLAEELEGWGAWAAEGVDAEADEEAVKAFITQHRDEIDDLREQRIADAKEEWADNIVSALEEFTSIEVEG